MKCQTKWLKPRSISLGYRSPWSILAVIIMFMPFGLLALQDLYVIWLSNLLTMSSTWWRLFQKRVVCTKLDIYVFFLTHTKNDWEVDGSLVKNLFKIKVFFLLMETDILFYGIVLWTYFHTRTMLNQVSLLLINKVN